MKKFIACLVIVLVFGMAGTVLAKDFSNEPEVRVPIVDGNDVIVPNRFIQTVPGATDDNVWGRLHDATTKWVKAVREGKNWRIPNGANQAMHPYIGDPADYKPTTNFAKLENVWPLDSEFIKNRGGNFYLFVTK